MVQINQNGTTEMFTGAYNKRVEQNRHKNAAEAYHAAQDKQPRQTSRDMLGTTEYLHIIRAYRLNFYMLFFLYRKEFVKLSYKEDLSVAKPLFFRIKKEILYILAIIWL